MHPIATLGGRGPVNRDNPSKPFLLTYRLSFGVLSPAYYYYSRVGKALNCCWVIADDILHFLLTDISVIYDILYHPHVAQQYQSPTIIFPCPQSIRQVLDVKLQVFGAMN